MARQREDADPSQEMAESREIRVSGDDLILQIAKDRELRLHRPIKWEHSGDAMPEFEQLRSLVKRFQAQSWSQPDFTFFQSAPLLELPRVLVGYVLFCLEDISEKMDLVAGVIRSDFSDAPVVMKWGEANAVLMGYGTCAIGFGVQDGRLLFHTIDHDQTPFRRFLALPRDRLVLVVFELSMLCFDVRGKLMWRFAPPDVIVAVYDEYQTIVVRDFRGDVHVLNTVDGVPQHTKESGISHPDAAG